MKIFLALRGAGKTYQLVQEVKNHPGAILVVATTDRVKDVREEYDLRSGQVCSVRQVTSLRGLTPIPTLYVDDYQFDPEVMACLRGFPIEGISLHGENEMPDPVVNYGVVIGDLKARMDAPKELHNRFTYHRPAPGQPERYEEIRAKGLVLAELVTRLCPASDELAEALVRIDEAVMWANAAIARNEGT